MVIFAEATIIPNFDEELYTLLRADNVLSAIAWCSCCSSLWPSRKQRRLSKRAWTTQPQSPPYLA
jgi:hypothetical protein